MSKKATGSTVQRHAEFSADRVFRYTLEIQVRDTKDQSTVQFIGLNPSTADEKEDDATMRRLKRFTSDWGYGRMIMTNLFAFRSRDPKIMKARLDPEGSLNRHWLKATAARADLIVACWGNHGTHLGQASAVDQWLGDYKLYCFGVSKDGHPLHPLRLSASLKPQLFRGKYK